MRSACGQQFDVPPGYLNTASIGVPPLPVVAALTAALNRWQVGADRSDAFDGHVATARTAFARLVGVSPDAVAVGTTVSQFVGLVAASIPDGTRVLTATGEFTSLTFPFAAQAYRGVTVTEVDLTDLPSCVEGHNLVAVSVVQSSDGAQVDLPALRAAAAAAGVMVLLDVSQAAGWMPLELGWADWVVGAAYKWLLAPRGAAWMALRSEALQRTVPHAANWYAGADRRSAMYGLPLRLAEDARRLDLSPAWFPQVGAATALPWLTGLDLGAVRGHCVRLADALLTGLGLAPRGCAIVAIEQRDAQQRLATAGITASVRAGRARLAFHLYNTEDDVDLALRALRAP